MLMCPLIFLAFLLIGIVGMYTIPEKVVGFSVLFIIGVFGTFVTMLYTLIIVIGACVEPAPILPLRSKRTSAAKCHKVLKPAGSS